MELGCYGGESGRTGTQDKDLNLRGIIDVLSETHSTFFPAEPGISQYPVFMVIKMDFSIGWEEGMGKFPCCSIEAVVNERL